MSLSFLFAQIFSFIALVSAVCSLQCHEKKNFLYFQTVTQIFYTLSFIFLNSLTGAVFMGIALVRIMLFLYLEKRGKTQNTPALLSICLCFILAAWIYYENFFTIIFLFGYLIFTYGTWQSNKVFLRFTSIAISTVLIIYNVIYHGWVNIVMESIMIASAVIFLIRVATENRKKLRSAKCVN